MEQRESCLDLLFGIGFKVGFLIVIIGLLMAYVPAVESTVDLTLDFMGFWESFSATPPWVQVILTGLMLVGAAIVVGSLKGLIESMVNSLLGRD
jgi:uncharacterized membrane protein